MRKEMDKILESIRATSRFGLSMTCKANGWEPGQMNMDHLSAKNTYLYIWDRPTGWVWACAVAHENLKKVGEEVAQNKSHWPAIRGALAYEISQAAARTALDVETEHRLGLYMSAYAHTTQTMETAKAAMPEGCHFIVCNYRRAGELDGMLRPVAAAIQQQALLPAETLHSTIQQVLAIDRARHPEWLIE